MTAIENHKLNSIKSILLRLSDFSYPEIKNLIGHLIPTFPIFTDSVALIQRPKQSGHTDGSHLFRVRPNELRTKGSTMLMPFQNVHEIGIVPKSKKNIPTGRCNRSGERIFYCSNFSLTACIESLSNGFTKDFTNTTATLGVWKINEPLHLAEMAFSRQAVEQLSKNTAFNYDHITKYTNSWYDHMVSELGKTKDDRYSLDFNIALFELFSDQFGKMEIKNESDYYITNLYSDVIFNHSTSTDDGALYDGIVYPSVRNALQEFNIALHPRAMKKITFLSAEHVWVTRYGSKFRFDTLETAFADDGEKLEWNIFKVGNQNHLKN